MTDLRTFADKKGAMKAGKRDCANLPDNVILLDIQPFDCAHDGRVGVEVTLDHLKTDKLDLSAIEGFRIEYAGKPVEKPAPKPREKAAPAEPKPKRKSGEVNVAPLKATELPGGKLIAARAGSKQQLIIDMLARSQGASLIELRTVCVKPDGSPWDDNSIRSALYYDVHQKGYGVRTEWQDENAQYFIVLPEGITEMPAGRTPKS